MDPTPETCEQKLQTAQAAVYATGKLVDEKNANTSSGPLKKIADSQYTNVVKATLSAVKDPAKAFLSKSRELLEILDKVAGLHPVIEVAYNAFKMVVIMEINREENNAKVAALYEIMYDLMNVLSILYRSNDVPPNHNATYLRLKDRMGKIANSITNCDKLCHTYHKSHALYEFAKHKKNLALDFQVHLTVLGQDTLDSVNKILREVDSMKEQSRDSVNNAFDQKTTEELTIKHIIRDKDAGSLQQNDDLLKRALQALCQVSGREAMGSDEPARIKSLFTQIKMELKEDVGKLIDKNSRAFEREKELVQNSIQAMGRDLLAAIEGRHHGQIENETLRFIWKDMMFYNKGWKGSVKAKHLAIVLRDHLLESRASSAHNSN
ncbi:hypothetical protein C8Q74DRAFT_1367152 [Fomes fomentarius]|nr:hypothetical protein C8Q74DRAFT_1367152 [Fomes fomentarius]